MLTRALLAFLALPCMVAGVVPWALSRLPGPSWGGSVLGFLPMLPGGAILIAAVVSFFRRGRGTLAPWDPPRQLVVQDLYRFNRNPMYVGVTLLVLGWAVLIGGLANALYAGLVPLVFHLRVCRYEEPEMVRLFGAEWERYRSAVPRWAWRRAPYHPEDPD